MMNESDSGHHFSIVAGDDKRADAIVHALKRVGCVASFQILEPRAALGAIKLNDPELVMVDLLSNRQDGLAFIKDLRQTAAPYALTPLLALCAPGDEATMNRAIELGASNCVEADAPAEQIVLWVRGMLGTRSRVLGQWAALMTAMESRNREVDEAHLDTLARLCKVAELRDDKTGEHTVRVGRLSGLIAQQLHLPPEEVRVIVHTAPVHDIGKVVIPDYIVLKRNRLDDTEKEIMRRHTTFGAEILGRGFSELLKTAEAVAGSHHERWDGRGYPAGLTGAEIPLPARIVAVADSFDAMTHERPYRGATPLQSAIAEIHQERGRQFDPEVVDALMRALGQEERSRRSGLTDEECDAEETFIGHPAMGGMMSWTKNGSSFVPLR